MAGLSDEFSAIFPTFFSFVFETEKIYNFCYPQNGYIFLKSTKTKKFTFENFGLYPL